MNRLNWAVVVTTVILTCTVAVATVWEVPEWKERIQWAIDDQQVQDGDTISVWGYGEPPFTYEENVDFLGKRLFLVNRSFLPGEVPYDSSWEHVTIDGRQLGTTVRIYGVLGTEPAVIKGFTITGGRNDFDWGI